MTTDQRVSEQLRQRLSTHMERELTVEQAEEVASAMVTEILDDFGQEGFYSVFFENFDAVWMAEQ